MIAMSARASDLAVASLPAKLLICFSLCALSCASNCRRFLAATRSYIDLEVVFGMASIGASSAPRTESSVASYCASASTPDVLRYCCTSGVAPRMPATSPALALASSSASCMALPTRKATLPACTIVCPRRSIWRPVMSSIGCTPGAMNWPMSPPPCGATCGTKVVGTVGMVQVLCVDTPASSSSRRRLRAHVLPMSTALPSRLVPRARPG